MNRFVMLIVVMTFITTWLASASAEDIERKQIVAVRSEESPRIDGSLEDSAWQQAQPSTGFIQTDPNRGEPMSLETSIRILYDDDNVYLGFQSYDTEPDKVFGSEMRRDYDIWSGELQSRDGIRAAAKHPTCRA